MSKLYSMLSSLSGGAAVALLALAVLACPVQNLGATVGDGTNLNVGVCPAKAGANGQTCAGCVDPGQQCYHSDKPGTCSITSNNCCNCAVTTVIIARFNRR